VGNVRPLSPVESDTKLRLGLLAAIGALAGCGGDQSPTNDAGLTVSVGESRSFPSGALEPGDKIVCVDGQRRVGAGVPAPGEGLAGAGSGGDPLGMEIEIETRSDGSVLVVCRR
jgi:hypothetical protein